MFLNLFYLLWIISVSNLRTLPSSRAPIISPICFLKVLWIHIYTEVHDPLWVNFCSVWDLGILLCFLILFMKILFLEHHLLKRLSLFLWTTLHICIRSVGCVKVNQSQGFMSGCIDLCVYCSANTKPSWLISPEIE